MLTKIILDELKRIDKKNNTSYSEEFKNDINKYDNLKLVLEIWKNYIDIWKEEREENFDILAGKIEYCLIVLNCEKIK